MATGSKTLPKSFSTSWNIGKRISAFSVFKTKQEKVGKDAETLKPVTMLMVKRKDEFSQEQSTDKESLPGSARLLRRRSFKKLKPSQDRKRHSLSADNLLANSVQNTVIIKEDVQIGVKKRRQIASSENSSIDDSMEIDSPSVVRPKKPRRKSSLRRNDASSRESKMDASIDNAADSNNLDGLKNGCAARLQLLNSCSEADDMFKWLINPVRVGKFFSDVWEKKPLQVRRHHSNYYEDLFSTAEFDKILREKDILYSVNLDITSYRNDERQTHNPVGRAYAPVVWDFYQQGCSIRLLNPQTYSDRVWKLNSLLQERFGTFVGANVYLTPPKTQGFAPHWDDIDAFVLQLEGKKHWRVYGPRTEEEQLPKFSSPNLKQSDIGKPLLECTLSPGDLLYIPRGFIHQALANEECHSLHITISACQNNTWGDYFSKLLPRALELAVESNVEFRKSLPTDYLNYMGVAHSENTHNKPRNEFISHVKVLLEKLVELAPIDASADQMAKNFIHDSLPPWLTKGEKASSIHGHGEHWSAVKNGIVSAEPLAVSHKIRLIRKQCLRMCVEGDDVVVYHNLENSRIYHEKDIQSFSVGAELAPGVEYLIHQHPKFSLIDHLPLPSEEFKLELATILYDKGLVVTEEPLEILDA